MTKAQAIEMLTEAFIGEDLNRKITMVQDWQDESDCTLDALVLHGMELPYYLTHRDLQGYIERGYLTHRQIAEVFNNLNWHDITAPTKPLSVA